MPPFYQALTPLKTQNSLNIRYGTNYVSVACWSFKGEFYIGTTGGIINVFNDEMEFQRQITLPQPGTINAYAINSNYLFVALGGGTAGYRRIYRSSNGVDFTDVHSFGALVPFGGCAKDNGEVFFRTTTNGSDIVWSDDDGDTWTVSSLGAGTNIGGSYANNSRYIPEYDLFITTIGSTKYRKAASIAGLIAGVDILAPNTSVFTDYAYLNNRIFACQNISRLYYSDDRGETWTESQSFCPPGNGTPECLIAHNGNIYGCDANGTLFRIAAPNEVTAIGQLIGNYSTMIACMNNVVISPANASGRCLRTLIG